MPIGTSGVWRRAARVGEYGDAQRNGAEIDNIPALVAFPEKRCPDAREILGLFGHFLHSLFGFRLLNHDKCPRLKVARGWRPATGIQNFFDKLIWHRVG